MKKIIIDNNKKVSECCCFVMLGSNKSLDQTADLE